MKPHLLLIAFALFLAHLYSPATVSAGDPELLHNHAVELARQGEHEKSLEQLLQAFSLSPHDEILKKNLAVAHVLVGRNLLERQQFQEAAAQFQAAVDLFPDDGNLHAYRGIALFAARDYDTSLYELLRAKDLGAENPQILYYIGRIYYDSGETERGVAYWEKAASLSPSDKLLQDALEKGRRELKVEKEMARGESGRFMVTYDGRINAEIADQLLDVLEDAYVSLGSEFGWYPTSRVAVILYGGNDFREVTSSPRWSGGLYDGKIRLPLAGVTSVTDRLRAVVWHEYSHALVHDITKGNVPVWLNEGIAEMAERRLYDSTETVLAAACKENRLMDQQRLESSFSELSHKDAALAYEQSYSLVQFMASTYGYHKLREILVFLGKGEKLEKAVEKGLADYGIGYAQVVQEWKSDLAGRSGCR